MNDLAFPVGFHSLHKDKVINFQLNRWHSMGYLSLQEVKTAGAQITGYDDWPGVMARLADEALAAGRTASGAFFFRAAQFFAPVGSPDRDRYMDRFKELFWGELGGHGLERLEIPYEGAALPALHRRGGDGGRTMVIHGGFDSFIEELSTLVNWFAQRGYDVVAFDGPGQGDARRRHGIVLDHRWEKPVGAVLDHLGLGEATLFGLSMGGWLCLRAAACEPRITKVVASSVPFDYGRFTGRIASALMNLFFTRMRRFTNSQARKRMQRDGFYNWYMSSVMFMTGTDTPVDGLETILQMNQANQRAADIKGDVLILTGRNDHAQPFKMHDLQIAACTGARSVTGRVFTPEQSADQHCQIGNVGLALQVVDEWVTSREA